MCGEGLETPMICAPVMLVLQTTIRPRQHGKSPETELLPSTKLGVHYTYRQGHGRLEDFHHAVCPGTDPVAYPTRTADASSMFQLSAQVYLNSNALE